MADCSHDGCVVKVYVTDRHLPWEAPQPVYCPRHCTKADCTLAGHVAWKTALAAAVAAAAICPLTRAAIAATNPQVDAEWRCDKCTKDFFAHPPGAAPAPSPAPAPAGISDPTAISGLTTVLTKAVDAINRAPPPKTTDDTDDSPATGTKASDWGLDSTMFADHPACWSPLLIKSFLETIKAESEAMAQMDERIRLANARKSGTATIIGSDIIEPVPISSHTSLKSLTIDARLGASTPSAEIRQVAALVSVQRCVTAAQAPTPSGAGDAAVAAGSAAGSSSAGGGGAGGSMAQMAGVDTEPGDGSADPVAATPVALSVPASDIRDGSAGEVRVTSIVNRIALTVLEPIGRQRLLAIFEMIASEKLNDATHIVLAENGKYVVVNWAKHCGKVILASYIMYLRRRGPQFEPPELPDVLITRTKPRRSPWPLRQGLPKRRHEHETDVGQTRQTGKEKKYGSIEARRAGRGQVRRGGDPWVVGVNPTRGCDRVARCRRA